MNDPLAGFRSFPKAGPPNADISKIRGNCSDDLKQLMANGIAYYAAEGTKVFASEQAKYLKLVEINFRRPKVSLLCSNEVGEVEAEIVHEIKVDEGTPTMISCGVNKRWLRHELSLTFECLGMLSRNGAMAGTCIAHLCTL